MHSASELIESFARTTAQRDRDHIEVLLARLLHEYFKTGNVAVYRVVEEDGCTRRVQRRALIDSNGREHGPVTARLSELPRLQDKHHWYECDLSLEAVCYRADSEAVVGTVFPLPGDGRAGGLIEIELMLPRNSLPARDVRLISGVLRLLANHLAILDDGQRDTLTGLLNRRTFEQNFDKIVGRNGIAAGGGSVLPTWFAIADIDRFKSINDRYGHLFGDDVLLLVSGLMRQAFRGSDQLYRFGGEEFVIVLEAMSPEHAQAVLDRLRRRIAEHTFPQIGAVTISIGYTRIGIADPPVTCFERADAALYYAKAHGRNQLRCHETLIARGELEKSDQAAACVELF